jgi:hypothetical protein
MVAELAYCEALVLKRLVQMKKMSEEEVSESCSRSLSFTLAVLVAESSSNSLRLVTKGERCLLSFQDIQPESLTMLT